VIVQSDDAGIGTFGRLASAQSVRTVNAIDCRTANALYVGEVDNFKVQKQTLRYLPHTCRSSSALMFDRAERTQRNIADTKLAEEFSTGTTIQLSNVCCAELAATLNISQSFLRWRAKSAA
jgi:hypothetical protein